MEGNRKTSETKEIKAKGNYEMTRKVASTNNKQTNGLSTTTAAYPQPWRDHIESVKAFHRITPYPRQQHHVVLPGLIQRQGEAEPAVVLSRRNQMQAMRLTGSATTEPVMDIVRTVSIHSPNRDVIVLLSEIALLTAEYFELQSAKRRLSE